MDQYTPISPHASPTKGIRLDGNPVTGISNDSQDFWTRNASIVAATRINCNPAIDISNANGNQDLWNAATRHRDDSPAILIKTTAEK